MRIVVTTGLFAPDIGGPATHAADVAAELRARGHQVTVLTLSGVLPTPDVAAAPESGVVRFPRWQGWPVRTAAGIAWLWLHRRQYDVVYATGLPLVAVPGARLAGKPVVLKVVGDPAWERGRYYRLTDLGFEDFQRARRVAPRLRALRAARNLGIRRATAVVTPGHALGEWVREWAPGREVRVVPNGVRTPAVGEVRRESGLRVVSAGRLVVHKRLDVLVDAVAQADGVELTIIGDGPARAALKAQVLASGVGDRVTFAGALPHDETMASLAAADALVAPSAYEGLPHVAIEALACGTPVVCAAATGLTEVVTDGRNGLLVEPLDAATLAAALVRLRDDAGLRATLHSGAEETGRDWRFDRTADELEDLFTGLVGRPRVVFVGKTRISDPPSPQIPAKFALHRRYLDQVTIGTGPAGRRTINGVRVICLPALRPAFVAGVVFYVVAPAIALATALARRPSAIVCQGPYEAAGVIALRRLLPRRLRPPVQVELHGDWRTGPRLYGSPARRLLGPLSDRVCAWTVRQATQVRAVSDFTEELARDAGYDGPVERYIAFSLYDAFLATPAVPPPPDAEPQALFVGALERYKAIDVLLDAWAVARDLIPGGRLLMVGGGSMEAWLEKRLAADDLAGTVERRGPVPQEDLVGLLDRSTCLVLPSRSEGHPRVAVEALARGRPVVASTAGGAGEFVHDGVNGRLVPPEDILALAEAIAGLLNDPAEAARLGAAGRKWVDEREPLEEYTAGIRRLATWAAERGR